VLSSLRCRSRRQQPAAACCVLSSPSKKLRALVSPHWQSEGSSPRCSVSSLHTAAQQASAAVRKSCRGTRHAAARGSWRVLVSLGVAHAPISRTSRLMAKTLLHKKTHAYRQARRERGVCGRDLGKHASVPVPCAHRHGAEARSTRSNGGQWVSRIEFTVRASRVVRDSQV
jgi:hypothetical protein